MRLRYYYYVIDVKLKNGRIFKRKGRTKAFTKEEVESSIEKNYPECKFKVTGGKPNTHGSNIFHYLHS